MNGLVLVHSFLSGKRWILCPILILALQLCHRITPLSFYSSIHIHGGRSELACGLPGTSVGVKGTGVAAALFHQSPVPMASQT